MKFYKAYNKNYSIEEQMNIIFNNYKDSQKGFSENMNPKLNFENFSLILNEESIPDDYFISIRPGILKQMIENKLFDYKKEAIIEINIVNDLAIFKNILTNKTFKTNEFISSNFTRALFSTKILNFHALNKKTINNFSKLYICEDTVSYVLIRKKEVLCTISLKSR